ncbi:MAG: UDP-N-acetylmuramate dehydrogenase [Moorea sp. SIO2B7]|nr:UDP-N-acetylmuramate dehydrogenase [Moorena sp. SIO2B7]
MTLSSDLPKPTPSLFYTPKKINQYPIALPGTDCFIKPQVSLANLTSFRVGGLAQWYVAPRNWEDLQASFEWFLRQDLPLTLLGAGSNLLVSDRGIPGLVISTRHLRQSQFDPETGQVTAGAGEPIARLAWQAAKRGWRGLEWAVGIPGTVGGAVVMNAGAHKDCAADILVNVLVVSPDGKVEELTKADLNYSYRRSTLQGDKRLVIQATFQLQRDSTKAEVMATTSQNLKKRKSSQPYDKPSCGSVFRNPTPHAAGWLIEQIGLKGYQIGDAQVAHRHANFILNCGSAKADDIFRLISYVQEQVESHWSLYLEPEVKLLGEF